jgi:CheY-like chemotaxis protein
MTTGKRALIVDDSRSARVILSRMLEQHGLAVDTAESAEQALEYLRQNRPDVIFMDHLMPGMDGFQAVQAIKADAHTATIPLMMYTSQEGELYVSQARALGAIGVLPKTVRPVDVSRVLYQLHLLPDRRQSRSALFDAAAAAAQPRAPAAVAAPGAAAIRAQAPPTGEPASAPPAGEALTTSALSELQGSLRQSLQQVVRDQLAEQRRFMLATFEAFARRMSGEFREAAARAPAAPVAEPVVPEPAAVPWWPMVLTALLAALPSVILGVLYWQSAERSAALARALADSRAEVAARAARAERPVEPVLPTVPAATGTVPEAGPAGSFGATAAPAAGPTAAAAPLAVETVPYGETPLAAARLERLRGLAATLEAQQFRGRIVVASFTGDFCLSGNAGEGFALADPALPTRDCDVVGNPFDDALSPAQRQSVAFANFAASLRQRTGGAILVETLSAGRSGAEAYPEQGEGSTAGDWNAVAGRNNRVEFRLVPAG